MSMYTQLSAKVHFLNEEAITERVADAMQQNLVQQNHSRTFEYQVKININTWK